MKITIIENTKNNIFDRQDVKAEIEEKIIPSRKEVMSGLAAQLNTDKNKIIVRSIQNKYGTNKIMVDAKAYNNEESLKKFEKKFSQKRNNIEEPKAEDSSTKQNESNAPVQNENPAPKEPKKEEVAEKKEDKKE